MCRVPESEWPGGGNPEVIEAIKLDFMGQWGDRESTSHVSCKMCEVRLISYAQVVKNVSV
jgi:hypothetical protein